MNDGKFTTQAAVLWGVIPLEAQERILKNVFCVKCRTSVRIVNFTGDVEKNGDLILKGSCAICGHKVVRVWEASEDRIENN
jgi:RNase P subunit RPR2